MTLSFVSGWRGRKVRAIDGSVGRVRDVYFDDQSWSVRYVVIDVGGRMRSDLRLVEPAVLQRATSTKGDLVVARSREAMYWSPSMEVDRPVSVQKLEEQRRFQGLRFYLDIGLSASGRRATSIDDLPSDARPGDLHLRSCRAVTGYRVMARDGAAGRVCDFVLDTERWSVVFIAVSANVPFRRPHLIPPRFVAQIDWESSTVEIAAERALFFRAPGAEPPLA